MPSGTVAVMKVPDGRVYVSTCGDVICQAAFVPSESSEFRKDPAAVLTKLAGKYGEGKALTQRATDRSWHLSAGLLDDDVFPDDPSLGANKRDDGAPQTNVIFPGNNFTVVADIRSEHFGGRHGFAVHYFFDSALAEASEARQAEAETATRGRSKALSDL
jgi:hypothetical protein